MSKYDAIRAEFVAGGATLADLAKAHGVSYTALRTAAGRQKWSLQRKESAERTLEALEARRAKNNNAMIALVKELGENVGRIYGRYYPKMTPKDCMYMAITLEKLQKISRTALGLPAVYSDNPQPAVRVDIGALAVALGQLQQRQPIVEALP